MRAVDGLVGREAREFGAVCAEFDGGEVGQVRVVFGHVPDTGAHAERIAPRVDAEHLDLAAAGAHEAQYALEEGALPSAVGPEQRRAPLRDREGDVVEGGDPLVAPR